MSNEMKKYEVELISSSKIDDVHYVFNFKKPEDFTFKEGQYGVFTFIDKVIEGRKMRAFSIASSNVENILKFGIKAVGEISDFKQNMIALNPGEKMFFTAPMGNFNLDIEKDVVLIAGGIGITPIRGIINQIKDIGFNRFNRLIHSNNNDLYPFKDEFDSYPFLNSIYVSGIEGTASAIKEAIDKFNNDAIYYVSGSPGFITGIKALLEENNIETSNIKYDRFTGY